MKNIFILIGILSIIGTVLNLISINPLWIIILFILWYANTHEKYNGIATLLLFLIIYILPFIIYYLK